MDYGEFLFDQREVDAAQEVLVHAVQVLEQLFGRERWVCCARGPSLLLIHLPCCVGQSEAC